MATEIERKFLLLNDQWKTLVESSTPYRQGYMASNKDCSVRVRIAGTKATLNIKSATIAISRQEYEYEIPMTDAQEMLDSLCDTPQIDKIRHIVKYQNHTWEIDEFLGDNAGLIVAEVELNKTDETFAKPAWLGDEVSEDVRYYNVNLIKHPYKNWT